MRSKSSRTSGLAAVLTALALSTVSGPTEAVGTRRFILDSLEALEGGDLTGVSITSNGEVRAGWKLGKTSIPDATSVWASLILPDGSVLLGTGAGGRIYKVQGGKVTIAAETKQMAVSALALMDGQVVAGTFPEGKIYKIPLGQLGGGEVKPWIELKETEDVWSLSYDAKARALYAATGPEGKLFRIAGGGNNAEVYFDSEETHLVSVLAPGDGNVYAGSNGKALLYKLTGPGRAAVLHDFEGDDVKALAVTRGGSIFAIANGYNDATRGLRPPKAAFGGLQAAGPQDHAPGRPGRGELWRFDGKGVAELMMKHDDTHYVTLSLDETGVPHVGSGAEGRVYSVDDNHVVRLLADTDERQVGAIVLNGKARFIATSDPVVYRPITGTGGADAVWTSKVLDAGLRAHFGVLEWRGDGTLEFETRSGSTDKPDNGWSGWSRPMAQPGKVGSPPARFLQIRARFGRDAKAVLSDVQVAFVTDNARALITDISAGDNKSNTGGSSVPASGGPIGEPDPKINLSWKVENPDNDTLRFRVFYKPVGNPQWFSMLQTDEELTAASYNWDTSGLPEGHYRVRVDASDELSNPPDRVTRHSLESRTVLVDNTPPRITKLTLTGNRLQGSASDGLGPIARIEFALVGGKSWFPIFPSDSVFDQATESFDVDVSANVPTGPHLVVVRVYDAGGNRITRTVSRGQR
jgi:hypothetical protein